MNKYRIWSIVLIILILIVGWFVYVQPPKALLNKGLTIPSRAFKLGLDLAGGTELIYRADVSQVTEGEITNSLDVLKDVIERRVNLYGVSEPIVQIEGAGTFSSDNKLIVDLPGVTDINEAIALIGQTPLLEFRIVQTGIDINASTTPQSIYDLSVPTGLTGRLLSNAELVFNNQVGGEPIVSLQFNSEGSELFGKITRENTGKILGIFLDKQPKSLPQINEEIIGGKAVISGAFSAPEARQLVKDLNYGALPVPIELIGTQTIGPSLGASAVAAGIKAGMWGLIILAIFMILWYRLPGFVAVLALVMYTILSLALFKIIPVTLTAAGIAGFILSIGMAVDANILIFERMKEELKRGKSLHDAMHEGFHRAWLSIRDSNISSMITAIILFWLGTSAVKGFALTFGLGVLVSMFTAITVSRTFLFALVSGKAGRVPKFLFGSGIK
ncbi:protein translocase subunit SecD [Candidatus Parcubacteria bacterium]|nr:protein translocase subunit SecD [Candidatus Parcubacteria bacterium]